MPDEPTWSGAGTPGGPTEGGSPDGETGAAPSGDDPYRWHGPSPHAYPGAEAYRPYGSPYGGNRPPNDPFGYQHAYGQQPPYGHYSQQSPYGPPQSTPYAWPYVPPRPPRAPISAEERRQRNRSRIALAVALVVAVGAGIGIGAAVAPTSPATVAVGLVNRAITSATAAGTYHYVERSTTLGARDDIAGDATPQGGRQVILQRCSGGTTYFHLRLVQGTVFFEGTRTAVVDQLGVPAAHAASVAGRWVKVVKGENPYNKFAEGITTSSNISQLRQNIVPFSSRSLRSSSGSTEVVGALFKTKVHNKTFGTASLILDASTGRPRSLRGSASSKSGGQVALAWTFGHYGESVHVTAPQSALSYSSLHAKPPAKGTCG